jgi:hypothetical protein
MKITLNWPYISFVILAALSGLGFIAWGLTDQVYQQWSRGLPITGGWSWEIVILVDIGCLLMFMALCWKVYCDSRLEITDEYISRPSIFGKNVIKWAEVTKFTLFNGVGYHIFEGKKKIVVSPHGYKNSSQLIQLLHSSLEKSDIINPKTN